MKNDPLVAKLYNKMQQEQNEYRAWLLAQPPEEILNHAYEYSSREDILIALENASLRPAQLRALLESQAPLADIYKDYRDCDTNTLDVMTLCIADRADMRVGNRGKQKGGGAAPFDDRGFEDDPVIHGHQFLGACRR